MPRTIRFHLDETCRRAIASGLRLHDVDVTTTAEAKLLTAADPEQLAYAIAQGRVLFTHDAHFTDSARTGLEHPGIIYCHQQRYTLGEVIRRLLVIWENREPEEVQGGLWYL
jgi:predicted nuclease of predicted toxin-antitoxin system